MATNVILSTTPAQLWNSAYSDVIFIFDFKSEYILSAAEEIIGSVGTGKTKITISGTWDINPVKNEYVYINTSEYAGIHRVLSSTNNTVVIDYEYNLTITGEVIIKSLRIPEFNLYKGFKNTEQFPTKLPYTFVTSFTYSFNQSIQIEINIKALLQKCFTIEPPSLVDDYDYSVFNAFRLTWDDQETDFILCLNSSIKTDELNALYVSGGYALSNVEQPLLWGCGNSFITIFEGGYPKLKIYNGYNQAVAGFNNAFQTNQFSQGFDIL